MPFVDPTAALREADRTGRRAYYQDDPHWNEVGHRVAAMDLAPTLTASCPVGTQRASGKLRPMNASSLALTVETVDEESRARGSRYLVALALVLAFGASVHAHRFVHNFRHHHWEDWRFFRHDHEFIHTLADCFTQPGAWPGLYRPLSTNLYYFWGAGPSATGSRPTTP